MRVLGFTHDSFSIKMYTKNAPLFGFAQALCICAVYTIKVAIMKLLGYFLSL